MPTALVTGASGFTGPYLVQALQARGYHVFGMGTESCSSCETLICDLTNDADVRQQVARARPDYVIHLAGISFAGGDDVESFYRVNLIGTLNLLEALGRLDTSPDKILVASSANVYGANARGEVDESVCPRPVNHYGCSKLAMEYMVATWYERLPIIQTRPFNYTGVGQDERFLIPKIVGHFRRCEPVIELGNIEVSRDYSDVRDVAEAYVALMESDARSEIVNICSGKAISLKQVIESMQVLSSHEIEIRVDPVLVRKNEIPRLLGSNERLRQLTGFVPEIVLENTLRWMYAA